MTAPSSLAKLALRRLADAEPSVEPPSIEERDAAVAAIAAELEAVRVRRRRRRTVAGALAVAASIVIAFVAMRTLRAPVPAASVAAVEGGVLVVRGEDGTTLARGGSVARGDRVVASAAGEASLVLRRGSELHANGGADVLVSETGATQVFELRAGSIDLRVAKLESGERFLVRTSDAEVEVRGTQFRVEVGERCNGTTTHVRVTEGVVVVRHGGTESRVAANEGWPAPCVVTSAASSAAPPPTSDHAAAPVPESVAVRPAVSARSAPSVVVAPAVSPTIAPTIAPAIAPTIASSDLAEQNRLYADAMAAKRRGDAPNALASLDRLLAAHPHGPLAESAAVERMRIVAASDPPHAADAARAYLARHPNGYARDEAKRLAGLP